VVSGEMPIEPSEIAGSLLEIASLGLCCVVVTWGRSSRFGIASDGTYPLTITNYEYAKWYHSSQNLICQGRDLERETTAQIASQGPKFTPQCGKRRDFFDNKGCWLKQPFI